MASSHHLLALEENKADTSLNAEYSEGRGGEGGGLTHQLVKVFMVWISLLLDDVCHSCLTWSSVDVLKERLQSVGVGQIATPHRAKP